MMEKINGLYLDLIVHPGETLKEVLQDKNMTGEELALRTGFSPKHISKVLNGKQSISSKFANRLEYALGIKATFWINLQGLYDEEMLEIEKANQITKEEFNVLNDLKEIIKYCEKTKIIKKSSKQVETVLNMRKFLNVNNLTVIPKLPLMNIAFRGSKNKINIYVLYSFLKICDYFTDNIETSEKLNKKLLKENLNEIKQTMFLEPNEMIKKLKIIFNKCGIIFEIVKHFSGAPVQGFIKEKNGKIILCMTIRQSFSDIFWFTLFHEISHILNNDFKEQFIDYYFNNDSKELKANEFAEKILINEKEYLKFKENNELNYNNIKKFAKKQNVLPGIIIGRIQKDTNDFKFMSQYKEQYKWI